MDWLKIIANLTGLADFWSKYFGKKSDEAVGAKLNQGETDAATIERLANINSPIARSESDELWERNKAKYGEFNGNSGLKPD